jgi:exopolysaccharide production protein ExoQ
VLECSHSKERLESMGTKKYKTVFTIGIPAMNKLLILFEKIFVVIAFIHYSGGPLLVILTNGLSEGEVDNSSDLPIINQLFMVIYSITFCLLLLRWKKVAPVFLKNRLIWILLLLAMFSISWSYSPDLTRTRVIALTGTTMFSLYISTRYSLKEQLYVFGWIFGVIVLTSLLFGVLLPKYGLMSSFHLGAWRGIYNHKNGLGRTMVPSAIVFYILALISQRRRWIFWSLLGGSILLILLSRASSPLVNFIILIGLLYVLPVLRLNYFFLVPIVLGLLSAVVIFYFLLTNNSEQFVGILGKDLTLTGRTNFWPLMIDKIRESPWIGYGFGSFWQGLDGPSAYVWNASEFKAPNGHNGYLDLCLDLGLIGLSIYMLVYVASFQKALSYIKNTKTVDGVLPLIWLLYIILSNLTESALILQNNFICIIQLSTFFSLSLMQPNKTSIISGKI